MRARVDSVQQRMTAGAFVMPTGVEAAAVTPSTGGAK
jgi:hypothetical protein